MSVELHIRTRGSLRPNPECDPVLTIFYHVHHDYPPTCREERLDALGVIAIDVHNSGFQAVDVTRHKVKSPRKRSPNKRPIKSPAKNASPDKQNGDQCGQNLASTPFAKGYLSGLILESDVVYVNSETELLKELVTVIRRFAKKTHAMYCIYVYMYNTCTCSTLYIHTY